VSKLRTRWWLGLLLVAALAAGRLAGTSPSVYLEDLAEALDSLAGYLRKAGYEESEARGFARDAEQIRRSLGLSRP
jgi:hypothetical protein